MIERYEVKRVDIDGQAGFEYHVDGELLRAAPAPETSGRAGVSVSVVPGALRFLVPERFYRLFHPFEYDAGFH